MNKSRVVLAMATCTTVCVSVTFTAFVTFVSRPPGVSPEIDRTRMRVTLFCCWLDWDSSLAGASLVIRVCSDGSDLQVATIAEPQVNTTTFPGTTLSVGNIARTRSLFHAGLSQDTTTKHRPLRGDKSREPPGSDCDLEPSRVLPLFHPMWAEFSLQHSRRTQQAVPTRSSAPACTHQPPGPAGS